MSKMRRAGRRHGLTEPLTSVNPLGGTMSIGRAIVIPAIVAFGVAGSTVATTAITVAAAHPTSVHVQASSAPAQPLMYYHG
jgi:hypothetical protein